MAGGSHPMCGKVLHYLKASCDKGKRYMNIQFTQKKVDNERKKEQKKR